MDDLIAFLRARYDEREQAANAATWHEDAGTWRAELSPYGYGKSPGPRWYVIDSMDDGVVSNVDPQASEDEGVAQHIALNDPAFVVADVAAKRRIIGWADSPALPDIERYYVLHALAMPYADHPDYREEWRL